MLHIWGEKNPGDVVVVGFEVGDGHELGLFAKLHEMPDIDATLEIVSIILFTQWPHGG